MTFQRGFFFLVGGVVCLLSSSSVFGWYCSFLLTSMERLSATCVGRVYPPSLESTRHTRYTSFENSTKIIGVFVLTPTATKASATKTCTLATASLHSLINV